MPPAKSLLPVAEPRPDWLLIGLCWRHALDWACEQLGIKRRFTKPAHAWANGQVERMNRTLKDATVKRYHYDSHAQLPAHLQLFLHVYNHARRLKSLGGLTPYEFICKARVEQPGRFTVDPTHHTLGPNTGQRCLNSGFRFSTNAAIPSF